MNKIYYDNYYEVPTEEITFYIHQRIWVDPNHKGEDYDGMGIEYTKEFFSKEDCSLIIDSFFPKDMIYFSRFGIKLNSNGIRQMKPRQFYLMLKSSLNNDIERIKKGILNYLTNKSLEEDIETEENQKSLEQIKMYM